MTITLNKVDIQVHIEFKDKEKDPIFSYTENGKTMDGGGTVRTETAGTYTLDPLTVKKGFYFTGVTFTDINDNCAQDFSFTLSDNNQAITITDTAKNQGTTCMVFHVMCNDKPYSSPDPQVKNREQN